MVIPTATRLDSLRYTFGHVVPYFMQGIFTRNKFWFSFWNKVHRDPLSVKFCKRLRLKYRSSYIYVRMLRGKSLLVLDRDGIQRILDNSPVVYADAPLKRRGMSHFQPSAVTISRGDEWRDRRRFNDAVLAPQGVCVHAYAPLFLEVVRDEVQDFLESANGHYRWEHFETLFERIAIQVIFGKGVRDNAAAVALKRMMRQSNRIIALRKSRHFDDFYRRIREFLAYAGPNSLVSLCREVSSTESTRVENQIPHWLFAMKDTLAENTVRALALILSHPEAEAKIRAACRDIVPTSPQAVDELAYLEGCIQEAMRLWPTTQLLGRETLVADALGQEIVPKGTQVIILNGFNHRDDETHESADSFRPERWQEHSVDYHFNHFSNGTQVCAGKTLALFIAKAVLVNLLRESHLKLLSPATLHPQLPLPHTYNYYNIAIQKMAPVHGAET